MNLKFLRTCSRIGRLSPEQLISHHACNEPHKKKDQRNEERRLFLFRAVAPVKLEQIRYLRAGGRKRDSILIK